MIYILAFLCGCVIGFLLVRIYIYRKLPCFDCDLKGK